MQSKKNLKAVEFEERHSLTIGKARRKNIKRDNLE